MSEPTDAERFPTLSEAGARMLTRLREHPAAPLFRNRSGNRLTVDDVARVRAFEAEVAAAVVGEQDPRAMAWVPAFLLRCYREIPHYRALGGAPLRLADVPCVSRADLARDIASFVPDSAPVERLINFRTSGTTGHPLLVASHPVVAASYLGFHRRALRRFGVTLAASSTEVGVVLLGHQRRCFTYVSVTPTLNESGLVKLNLHPADWRDPDDRRRYLEDLAPEVIAGDPISFGVLLGLKTNLRPKALLSTSMALLPGLRRELEEAFLCPVADLYSLNEAGPVAVFDPACGGHVLLQPHMLVEIVDDSGNPVPPGTRGEITLTGGFNFCLPLLRYRTGDHASLVQVGGEPVLRGLEGRAPVRFRTTTGAWLNNIEITHAFEPLAMAQFQLHQKRDGALVLRVRDVARHERDVRGALGTLFGAGQALTLEELGEEEGKGKQYLSELAAE